MEAPAEVEWSTAGKWRRRPAQPAAVLTGSASPPLPCKAIPAKNGSDASVRGRSGPGKATAAVGAYLRVSGPLGPLTSVYPRTYRDTTHRDDEE